MSNLITATAPTPTFIRPTTTSLPAAQTAQPANETGKQATPSSVVQTEAAAEKAAEKAAEASFSNTYAISDKKFAIYKDATGQLITRYVSLRDGSVTYEPTPTFVKAIPSTLFIKA